MNTDEHVRDESMHPINSRLHLIQAENNKLNATGEFTGYTQVQMKHTAKFTLDILRFQHFKRKSHCEIAIHFRCFLCLILHNLDLFHGKQ